ncbi:unnamed protein product [Schistosoma mattheei]|uniref:Uncharacterized protein n=1 Tax=Schistosoma mattheei TaxID=31246 RepID=A0A183PRS5_9TREM|nr:unnamed protein product [Schistosoma mattheei]
MPEEKSLAEYVVYLDDSHIFDGISCKSEENMLNEPNHDRQSDVVLIDADVSNDHSLSNDTLNKFKEIKSDESNPDDIISDAICPDNVFLSCEKLVQCEVRVLNEFDFDYNSDDFISTVVYLYHEVPCNESSNQCEKYVLNEATLFITW